VSILAGFADISLGQLVLVGGMAMLASIVGGLAGYGTGALMPLVLVPIVGAEPVVPMLSISALLNNASRASVFRHLIDLRRVVVVLPAALPLTLLGAWGYTQLTGRGVAIEGGAVDVAATAVSPSRKNPVSSQFSTTSTPISASRAITSPTTCRPASSARCLSAKANGGYPMPAGLVTPFWAAGSLPA
jgi:uncharacterized membrane protein YfcA